MEDKIQARFETFTRLPLTYKARYEPVWMWTRGKNKAAWLRGTEVWKQEWFRAWMEMSRWNWVLLAVVSYLLVFIPCAFAFWIEYATPTIGLGCRALTILVYACAQLVFVILSAWSHFKAVHQEEYWQRHTWLNRLRRKWVGILVAIVFLLPAWIAAMFTTFAGTLMQITGIYQNCLCAAGFPPRPTIGLASDTQEDRDSSRYWSSAGYVALGFLFCVTYFGWWCQRYLRDVFMERVNDLTEDTNDLQNSNGTVQPQGPAIDEQDLGVPKLNDRVQHVESVDSRPMHPANGHAPIRRSRGSNQLYHNNQSSELDIALSDYQQYSRQIP